MVIPVVQRRRQTASNPFVVSRQSPLSAKECMCFRHGWIRFSNWTITGRAFSSWMLVRLALFSDTSLAYSLTLTVANRLSGIPNVTILTQAGRHLELRSHSRVLWNLPVLLEKSSAAAPSWSVTGVPGSGSPACRLRKGSL